MFHLFICSVCACVQFVHMLYMHIFSLVICSVYANMQFVHMFSLGIYVPYSCVQVQTHCSDVLVVFLSCCMKSGPTTASSTSTSPLDSYGEDPLTCGSLAFLSHTDIKKDFSKGVLT